MLASLPVCWSQRCFLIAFWSCKLLRCIFAPKYAGSCWVFDNNLTVCWMSCSLLFSIIWCRHKDIWWPVQSAPPLPFNFLCPHIQKLIPYTFLVSVNYSLEIWNGKFSKSLYCKVLQKVFLRFKVFLCSLMKWPFSSIFFPNTNFQPRKLVAQ